MKKISILGSTGSIGESTLKIVRIHPDKFKVISLAAGKNISKLYKQIIEFNPKIVCVYDEKKAKELKKQLSGKRVKVVSGDEGLLEASVHKDVEQVICGIVGAVGLKPLFESVRAGKSVGIANKEPLVMAGKLLLKEAKKYGSEVLPIDSEHSALWQCLEGHPKKQIKKLMITSSGGPFRQYKGPLSAIKPAQALKHPKWKMGPKITIDSATLMNKGLEVIEAANLFDIEAKKIEVLVHPEAIIHGLVEFVDGSHVAHLGITDMRLPIQYALSYPERLDNHLPTLDLIKLKSLSFDKPNLKRFPCLALGYEASRLGGSMPTVLNAANEVFVPAFLEGRIKFHEIPKKIEKVMNEHFLVKNPNLDKILQVDLWSREKAKELL